MKGESRSRDLPYGAPCIVYYVQIKKQYYDYLFIEIGHLLSVSPDYHKFSPHYSSVYVY